MRFSSSIRTSVESPERDSRVTAKGQVWSIFSTLGDYLDAQAGRLKLKLMLEHSKGLSVQIREGAVPEGYLVS